VFPATVSVPVRDAAFVLAAAVKDTDPFPVPEAPAVTVIHESLLIADQLQVPPIVTLTAPVPPAAVNACDIDPSVALQNDGCVTVMVCPATVIVPVRVVESPLKLA
jgi:hypothetical protein